MASQHSTLSPERWAGFPLAHQILMIGNEMKDVFTDPGGRTDAERADQQAKALNILARLHLCGIEVPGFKFNIEYR